MPSNAPTTESHQLTVRIPARTYAELRRRADREGSPVASVTRRLLASALAGPMTTKHGIDDLPLTALNDMRIGG